MTKFLQRAKGKVIDTTATVISGPSVLRSKGKERQSNFEADALRVHKETKHLDLTGKDHTDPIFRARATAKSVLAGRAKK